MKAIKISEKLGILDKRDISNRYEPMKVKGKILCGTFIARMDLGKKENEYTFPKDWYAFECDETGTYECKMPKMKIYAD